MRADVGESLGVSIGVIVDRSYPASAKDNLAEAVASV